MRRNLKSREKALIIITIVSLIITFGWSFLVIPLQEDTESLETAIASKKGQLRKLQHILKQSQDYEIIYKVLSERFHQNASDAELKATLVQQIQNVAEDFNFRITNLRPQNVRKQQISQIFAFDLMLDADPIEVWRFIYILQQDPYNFQISNARFDKVYHNNADGLRIQLTLSKSYVMQD